MSIKAGSRLALGVVAGLLLLLSPSPLQAVETVQARGGGTVQIGGRVNVPEGTTIDGDVVLIGGTLDVRGTIDGNAVTLGGTVRVSGTVRGNVVALGERVELNESAVVEGNVVTAGGRTIIHPDARIEGRTDGAIGFGDGRIPHPLARTWELLLIPGLFAVSLLILALWPARVEAVTDHFKSNTGRSLVIGLLTMILALPAGILMVVTIIGIPVALLLAAVLLAARLLGYTAVAGLVGKRVMGLTRREVSRIWELAVGVTLLGLIGLVPLVGWLIGLLLTAAALGSALDTRFGTNRPWFPPRNEPGRTQDGNRDESDENRDGPEGPTSL